MCPDFFRHPLYSGCWDTILFISPVVEAEVCEPQRHQSAAQREVPSFWGYALSTVHPTLVCVAGHMPCLLPFPVTLKSRSMGVSSSPPPCSHPWQTTTLGLSWGEKTADQRRLQLHLFTWSWFSKKNDGYDGNVNWYSYDVEGIEIPLKN